MKRIPSFLFACVLALSSALPAFADTSVTMTASCTVFTRSLSMGMADSASMKDVTALQDRLTVAGYLAPGTANGTFGPKTHAAVQALQRANNLSAQGYVGPLTWAVLQKKGCMTENNSTVLSFVAMDIPDALVRGTDGTWILQFAPRTIAPSTLKFEADWGDGTETTGPVVTTGSGTTTLAFFAHAYKKSGTYKTTFTITPPTGEPLRIRSSVRAAAR